jgi:hypothetical protein
MTDNENRRRVYIVNDSGHRYDIAKKVVPDAELVPMTVGNVNPTQVDRLSFELSEYIARSEKEDYLLLSGTPVLNALAGMLWILRHETCNLLIFDAKIQNYVVGIVTRSNFQRILDEQLFR